MDDSSRRSRGEGRPSDASSSLSSSRRHKNSIVKTPPLSTLDPVRPSERKTNVVGELPIAKLKLSSQSPTLYGRAKEIQTLQQCFHNLAEKQQRQLTLISGFSGTGKSALARVLKSNNLINTKFLQVQGKFDFQLRNEPYSGILLAFREICATLVALDSTTTEGEEHPNDIKDFQKDLKTSLGAELPILLDMIPLLDETMPAEQTLPARENGATSGPEQKNRSLFAFQRFFRVVCNHFQHIIMVLDDMQWADLPSLELLDILVSDRENHRAMIIGTYRSNEVDEAHVFSQVLKDLREKQDDHDFTTTELPIGNLELPAVVSVVQDALNTDDSLSIGLAELCFLKTDGNAHFLRLFLSTLYEQNLLQFNLGLMKWRWDAAEIEAKIPASDNVIDLLKSRMVHLSVENLTGLQLAACLGFNFQISMVRALVAQTCEMLQEGDDDNVKRTLDTLQQEGYLVNIDDVYYEFAHDKIQEACLDMIPSDMERNELFCRVGTILKEQFDVNELESAIFIVVDLLNIGSSDTSAAPGRKAHSLELSKLNSMACKKALSLSAFEAAAIYAKTGIRLLDDIDRWSSSSALSLELFSMGAQAESYLGHVKETEKYCNEVISQDSLSTEDKFRAYHALIDITGHQGKLREASDQCLLLLKKFNCRFPSNKTAVLVHTLYSIMRVKIRGKTWLQKQLDSALAIKNPTRNELMNFLNTLSTFTYMLHDPLMPLVVFRMFHWTLKYGVDTYSPTALAATAIIFIGALNDIQGGAMIGKQALQLFDRMESGFSVEARTHCLVYGFVLSWSAPWASLLRPLLQCYETGLRSGDTESASIACFLYGIHRFHLGISLDRLEADTRGFALQMEDLKRLPMARSLAADRQMYLNLMGRNSTTGQEDLTVLDGEALSAVEVEQLIKEDLMLSNEVKRNEAMLCTFFGSHQKLAKRVLEEKGKDLEWMAAPNLVYHAVARGVSSFAAFRETKIKGYKKMGMLMRSKIKAWVDKGHPNVLHFASLLDAELEAANGNKYEAIRHYQAAVLVAARGGTLQDAALSSERFGELYLEMNDEENASHHLRQARQYFTEFGAHGKVWHLEKKYSKILSPKPMEICTIVTGDEKEIAK